MQTFNQALATLYHKRSISLDVAMQRSNDADELKELIERGSGVNVSYSGGPGAKPASSASTNKVSIRVPTQKEDRLVKDHPFEDKVIRS